MSKREEAWEEGPIVPPEIAYGGHDEEEEADDIGAVLALLILIGEE